MNVYQKVLVRVFEETGGLDSKAVYLRDVVKDMGFLPSYDEIFSQMSSDGWITETSRLDEVKITPWGVREAKKVKSGGSDNTREVGRASKSIKSEVKQLLVMVEELVDDANEKRLKAVENKVSDISEAIKTLKDLL
ncbi:MAG: hypothetical protein OEM82_09280 [Acidobacteriota bacterium]|nr:hypothetical protein [Acidobacteriota bacterium]